MCLAGPCNQPIERGMGSGISFVQECLSFVVLQITPQFNQNYGSLEAWPKRTKESVWASHAMNLDPSTLKKEHINESDKQTRKSYSTRLRSPGETSTKNLKIQRICSGKVLFKCEAKTTENGN